MVEKALLVLLENVLGRRRSFVRRGHFNVSLGIPVERVLAPLAAEAVGLAFELLSVFGLAIVVQHATNWIPLVETSLGHRSLLD